MNELSLEQKEKLEKLKLLFDLQQSFIIAKVGVIPVIASLSATILIVATFNERLLQITQNLKIALTILLFLIPLSLIVYNIEYFLGIKTTQEEIEKIVGKDLLGPKGWWQKTYENALSSYPIVGTLILSGVIIYIIFAIW